MVNMQALKAGKLKTASDDAYDTGIGTQFSAETNIGDTDEEMMKYIEEQLKKKKGIEVDHKDTEANKYLTPEEAAILALPAHLRESSTKKSEEMLSNQMLNGIPEVDLGIESKIKNIEATEEAKQKLLADQKSKKDLPSQFVPKNYAVNFVQHNRCKIYINNDFPNINCHYFHFQSILSKPTNRKNDKIKRRMREITQKFPKRRLTTIILISLRNSFEDIKTNNNNKILTHSKYLNFCFELFSELLKKVYKNLIQIVINKFSNLTQWRALPKSLCTIKLLIT